MRRSLLGLAALALTVGAAVPASAQSAKVQVGVLACDVAPSVGFVLGSIRELTCELRSAPSQPYTVLGRYKGTVSRFGIDIGVLASNRLAWGVFAPTVSVGPGDLAGSYVGVSADATWAVGAGVNVLLGGSNQSIALQPLSVEGMTGASIAAGVADMKLEAIQ